MTDKHIIILRAIGIAIGTIIIVSLIISGYVLLRYARIIEKEVYIGGL
jgi:hypothetical protein